jgi:hypothetical protein
MISRVAFTLAIGLACAGCSTYGNSSTTPAVGGRDALGKQVYSLSGDRLAALEASANSECPGTTRPYMKTISGSGNDVAITYTCE